MENRGIVISRMDGIRKSSMFWDASTMAESFFRTRFMLLRIYSMVICSFIYRDRRQSSPLPQQIKPEAGKGHPIQSSDLLHIFLSVSLGGVAYRRRSGVILFLQHGVVMPVPFLMTVPFFFLPSEKQKKPDILEQLLQNVRLKFI